MRPPALQGCRHQRMDRRKTQRSVVLACGQSPGETTRHGKKEECPSVMRREGGWGGLGGWVEKEGEDGYGHGEDGYGYVQNE